MRITSAGAGLEHPNAEDIGQIDASATHGEIGVATPGKPIDASATHGEIRVTTPGKQIDASATHGEIRVTTPGKQSVRQTTWVNTAEEEELCNVGYSHRMIVALSNSPSRDIIVCMCDFDRSSLTCGLPTGSLPSGLSTLDDVNANIAVHMCKWILKDAKASVTGRDLHRLF